MQESKWHRPCTHKKQMPISTSAVQDFTRHLMGASSAALCSAFCFVLQGFAWSKCYDDKSHRDASRLDGLKADHWGAPPWNMWNSEWKELPWVARLNLSPPRAKVPSPLLAVPDCNNKLSASHRATEKWDFRIQRIHMGLSENSVPLHPMVNDHYPH